MQILAQLWRLGSEHSSISAKGNGILITNHDNCWMERCRGSTVSWMLRLFGLINLKLTHDNLTNNRYKIIFYNLFNNYFIFLKWQYKIRKITLRTSKTHKTDLFGKKNKLVGTRLLHLVNQQRLTWQYSKDRIHHKGSEKRWSNLFHPKMQQLYWTRIAIICESSRWKFWAVNKLSFSQVKKFRNYSIDNIELVYKNTL